MNSGQLGIILRQLRKVAPADAETDAALLASYGRGQQAAFAELVA